MQKTCCQQIKKDTTWGCLEPVNRRVGTGPSPTQRSNLYPQSLITKKTVAYATSLCIRHGYFRRPGKKKLKYLTDKEAVESWGTRQDKRNGSLSRSLFLLQILYNCHPLTERPQPFIFSFLLIIFWGLIIGNYFLLGGFDINNLDWRHSINRLF